MIDSHQIAVRDLVSLLIAASDQSCRSVAGVTVAVRIIMWWRVRQIVAGTCSSCVPRSTEEEVRTSTE
jgi:hypothetical protein